MIASAWGRAYALAAWQLATWRAEIATLRSRAENVVGLRNALIIAALPAIGLGFGNVVPGAIAGLGAFFVAILEPIGVPHRGRAWPLFFASLLDPVFYYPGYVLSTAAPWVLVPYIGALGYLAGYGGFFGDSYSVLGLMFVYMACVGALQVRRRRPLGAHPRALAAPRPTEPNRIGSDRILSGEAAR